MRICFAYSNHHLSATTAQPGIAYKLALKAKAIGHKVSIVSNVQDDYEGKRSDGIYYFLFSGQGNLQTYLKQVRGITNLLRRENPDVIHVHGNLYFIYLLVISWFLGKKVTVYITESLEIHDPFFRRLFLMGLSFAKKIFVSCEALKEELVGNGINIEKILTVRIGLDDKFFRIKSELRDIDVLYFGDSSYSRGFDVFVKCAESLPERKFIGLIRYYKTDCPEILEIATKLPNLQLFYHPYRESIEQILTRAKIIFLPFRTMEVRPPVTILEALATGSCIVTSMLSGNQEVISPGVSGFMTNPDDLNQNIRLISGLLNDDKKRKSIATFGRRRIKEIYKQSEYEKLLNNL